MVGKTKMIKTPKQPDRSTGAKRDIVAGGIVVAAILLFVGTGSTVMQAVVRTLIGIGGGPDSALAAAMILNVALILFGWRRYEDLNREIRERTEAEQRARYLADTDPLTGFLNRRSLLATGQQQIAGAIADKRHVALFLLDWKLATFSLIILPVFVRVARRIGNERRRISTKRQKLLSDLSVQIEESLSVSGILLGKTTGSARALTDKFAAGSQEVASVELAAMMAGKWRMATIQISFAVMPALVYWFAGITIGQGSALTIGTLVAFTALQT